MVSRKRKKNNYRFKKVSNSDANHDFHDIYPKISLHKIPFEAFKSIIFGYACTKEFIDDVTGLIINNRSLSHIHIKHVKHDHFGKLVFKDNK